MQNEEVRGSIAINARVSNLEVMILKLMEEPNFYLIMYNVHTVQVADVVYHFLVMHVCHT
jgi:hypothetical protein